METIKFYEKYIFKHPFTAIVAGPTGSGKTRLIFEIISKPNQYIYPNIDTIIYCFSEWQQIFNQYKHIKFHKGLIDIEKLDSKNKKILIIIDDLMEESQTKQTSQLFTRGSHHKNISIILVLQNLFPPGKFSRTISINTHYIIVFKNPRDKLQIMNLAKQMFPGNSAFLIKAYDDATLEPNGYIFIDNKQETPNEIRIQSNITDTYRIVYKQIFKL